jgi:LmbE family N-acetylglucosaminyl deacetylase
MLEFDISAKRSPQKLLLVGAHCDDIEIGMGATLRRYSERHPEAQILWVTLSSNEVRAAETRVAGARLLSRARNATLVVKSFREGYFPYIGAELKDFFESLKSQIAPDIVFTHWRDDLHQDHRIASELTWNTFRDHLILEYEIPKYDGDLRTPNLYVPISKEELELKVEILMTSFPSQVHRSWFTPDTFRGIARLRGIECNAPEAFAEAFHCRKANFAI